MYISHADNIDIWSSDKFQCNYSVPTEQFNVINQDYDVIS